MSLCQCGCGGETSLARITNTARGYVKGQPYRYIAGHNWRRDPKPGPDVYKQRYTPTWKRKVRHEHAIIAERVLGRPLPVGAEVHHVDGNTLNNANTNLVICQDKAYHKLLHWRERIIKAGGNPNVGKFCSTCKQFKPFAEFNRSEACKHSGRTNRCRPCSKSGFREWASRKKHAA